MVDDSIDVSSRVNNALIGKTHVDGVGKNIATGIIHVCDTEDKYGVWNSRTEETLQLLKRAPTHALTPGETYTRINQELSQLKIELATDLLVVDSFMWYISKRVKVIERPS